MNPSYQSQYYQQQPDNSNLGALATGALAIGGLSTVALMNDGKLLKDLSGKKDIKETMAKGAKAVNDIANYSKQKASELRKQATPVLKKMGIDPNMLDDNAIRQVMSQFSNTNTSGVKVGSLKDRMAAGYDRNINKIRGRRGY
tara:strand:- start:45 stop:473 length:429 start_codon:yes stop_codon:yes gene_type:complete